MGPNGDEFRQKERERLTALRIALAKKEAIACGEYSTSEESDGDELKEAHEEAMQDAEDAFYPVIGNNYL